MRARNIVIVSLVLMGLGIAGGMMALGGGAPADAKFVGSAKCRSCHLKEYMSWRKTKHAKVYEQLQGDEKKNPECLKCHTTGYGKPSGFSSEDATPLMKDVGCEVCHGPGSTHCEVSEKHKDEPKDSVWDRKIDRKSANCNNCHNPHINQKKRVEELRAK